MRTNPAFPVYLSYSPYAVLRMGKLLKETHKLVVIHRVCFGRLRNAVLLKQVFVVKKSSRADILANNIYIAALAVFLAVICISAYCRFYHF